MLNTFPILLSFAIFVPFIFRICVALFLLELMVSLKKKSALKEYFSKNQIPFSSHLSFVFQITLLVCSVFLFIGLYTQIISLITIYFVMTLQKINKQISFIRHSENVFTYIALITFSLLFLGAGAFAFDLPL